MTVTVTGVTGVKDPVHMGKHVKFICGYIIQEADGLLIMPYRSI
ncbi:hypothetical protein ES708_16710 [subsurface metagenome]